MVPSTTPNAIATRQSSRVRPRSVGRTSAPSTRALVASRSQTRVNGAASSNTVFAIPAPSCTDAMPTTTNQTGGTLDSTHATYPRAVIVPLHRGGQTRASARRVCRVSAAK